MTTSSKIFDQALVLSPQLIGKLSALKLAAVWLAAFAVLIMSAKLQIPFVPVPVTMQSAVIVMMPCLIGLRLSLSVLAGYFMAGLLGAPVFALAAAGPAYFIGSTGGYLIGFALAIFAVGKLFAADQKLIIIFTLMLLGQFIILLSGFIWLAFGVPDLGVDAAFINGVAPFITGSIAKSVFAACIIGGTAYKLTI